MTSLLIQDQIIRGRLYTELIFWYKSNIQFFKKNAVCP